VERYFAWVGGMMVGDFGTSYTYRTPIAQMIAERMWVSLPLALYALALSTLIAFPIGIWAATHRGSATDVGVMGATQLGVAVPNFWFAMILVLIFAVNLRWFSAGGFPGWDAGFWAGMKALTLPAIALALPQASILSRVMRSSILDTLGEDFMRTARAKGLTRGQALWRHALRNALIPVLTIIGLQFSFLLAGAIIIENVFFLPGLGRLVFQAISQRDLIVVESVVMLLVLAVILVTFLSISPMRRSIPFAPAGLMRALWFGAAIACLRPSGTGLLLLDALRRHGARDRPPPAGALGRALVRDRPLRSGRLLDDHGRRRCVDSGGAGRRRDRHGTRGPTRARCRRPARQLARRDHHARQRSRLRLPRASDRHHDHRGLRALGAQRDHRHRHLQCARLRPAQPGRGAQPLDPRLRSRGPARGEGSHHAFRSSTSCQTSPIS
jgi:peptide/nickel transport system permease protein